MNLADLWPLARLRVISPTVELRYPTDDDLVAMAGVAVAGIHEPNFMPFGFPWTDAPAEQIGPNLLRYHWQLRATSTPDNWSLPLAVLVNGEVIGCQDVLAEQFAVRHEVLTGSWISLALQGRGIGSEMRAAVLHFAFEGLGASTATSSAFVDNRASLRVSEKLGYAPNGTATRNRRGTVALEQRLLLTRAAWEARRRDDISIEGLAGCLDWFGAN